MNKFQSEVGGPLRGGDPGRRLIEPAQNDGDAYFEAVPAPFAPRPGAWLLVPIYHIFGSEELSLFAPAVVERAPRPYLVLNQEDAHHLQVWPADEVELRLADTAHRLPVNIDPALPRGLAGLSAGLPAVQGVGLPAWCHISRVDRP